MKKPHAPAVRALLREHAEGLTINQICAVLTNITNTKTCANVLKAMPDVYIDRWANPKRGQYQAVYCIVTPPNNCPYPTDNPRMVKTEWRKGRSDSKYKEPK